MDATMTMPAVTGATVTGYEFEGEWDPGDRVLIEAVMRQCLPGPIPPVYDTWKLLCFRNRFIARRLTWTIGGNSIYARDIGELAQALLGYHGKGDNGDGR